MTGAQGSRSFARVSGLNWPSNQDPPGSRVLLGGSWPSLAGVLGSASCRARQQVITSKQPIGGPQGKDARCPILTPSVAGKAAPWWIARAAASAASTPSTWTTAPGSPSGPWSTPACSAPGPSFVPLAQATPTDHEVRVPYDKQLVKDAPRIDPDGHLSEAEERQLWRHYGLDYDRTTRRPATGRDTVGRDVSGPTTDEAMTRSEEELRVGTAQRERGRVRLR